MRRIGWINLLGKRYRVYLGETDDPLHMGEYCSELKQIVVREEYPRRFHTVGHEIGHVFWEETGLGQVKGIEALEEPFCQLLGALLEDNIEGLMDLKRKLDEA